MTKEKKEWVSNLATNLKIERKKQGLSQQALAEKAKLTVGTVSKLETEAEDNPTLETIAALGYALQLNDSLKLLKN